MKRPLVNLLSLLSGDLGSRFLGFLITVYLARVLEPSGFGIVSLGFAVLGYLQLAGSAGIPVIETRNTAAAIVVDGARVSAVLSLRLILAALLWALTVCIVMLSLDDSITRDVIMLLALTLFPLALQLDWFFQGKEAFFATSLSRLLQYVVYGLFVLLFVHGVGDIRQTAIAFVAGVLSAVVLLWVQYRHRWGKITFPWAPSLWREILSKGFPVGVAMFLAQSVTNLPPLVIGYFSSAADIGLFSAAMKLIFLLLLVDRLFNALFLPVVTRYVALNASEVHTLVDTTLRLLLAVVIPLAVAAIIVGREVMFIVLGEKYVEAVSLFHVLMGYFVLTVLNSLFVCILFGFNHERGYTKMVIAGSTILCVATVVGTARYGSMGAACGVLLGELVTMLLMMFEARKVVRVVKTSTLLPPMVAGVCMALSALLLRDLGTVVTVVVSSAVFVAVEILFKGVTVNDMRFLRERFV